MFKMSLREFLSSEALSGRGGEIDKISLHNVARLCHEDVKLSSVNIASCLNMSR